VNDLLLIVSELVSNAVLHGRPPIELVVRCDPDHVTIEVTDQGSDVVTMRETDGASVGGRGLHIVDTLADEWGTQTNATGNSVWATVHTQPQN